VTSRLQCGIHSHDSGCYSRAPLADTRERSASPTSNCGGNALGLTEAGVDRRPFLPCPLRLSSLTEAEGGLRWRRRSQAILRAAAPHTSWVSLHPCA